MFSKIELTCLALGKTEFMFTIMGYKNLKKSTIREIILHEFL